jgi:uncharacterized protein
MTTYVDSSALLKRYVQEADSDIAERLILADPVLVTSWITEVEVRRNVARLVDAKERPHVRRLLAEDLDAIAMVSCDQTVAAAASVIGETLGVRALDAIHLASAQRLQIPGITFLTFDLRQGQAARTLGFNVLGC